MQTAIMDGLDGFLAALDAELDRAARYDCALTLIVLDLEGFGRLNEEQGPEEGDRVLGLVADAARANLRRSDVAARIGGDEFAVLLLNTGRHAGARFLSRLRRALPLGLELSAGLAHFPDDAATPKELLEIADRRLRERCEERSEVVG